jgi:hypothetical protein
MQAVTTGKRPRDIKVAKYHWLATLFAVLSLTVRALPATPGALLDSSLCSSVLHARTTRACSRNSLRAKVSVTSSFSTRIAFPIKRYFTTSASIISNYIGQRAMAMIVVKSYSITSSYVCDQLEFDHTVTCFTPTMRII